MTRINLVEPSTLSDKHLLAEYRELPRIFTLAFAAWGRGERLEDARNPTEYCLGSGHVRFFYTKLSFLRARFLSLVSEMWLRGWDPAHLDVPACYHKMPDGWCQDYIPTPEAIALNLARLRERNPEHYQ